MNDGKHVFCFGSNLAGRHGAGAAKEALNYWGAKYGRAIGHHGKSYAIPTKDFKLKTLPLDKISLYVEDFKDWAESLPDLTFLVTKIGCGLAGYEESDIAPMFKDAPSNCVLPEGWR